MNSSEENAKISRMLESFVRPALKDCALIVSSGGGEFFASRPLLDFFKTLSKAQYPKLKLLLATNGTLFTPENWNKLQNLKGMVETVSVSIDAAEKETYEKLRRGGRWDILCDNMEYISSLKAAGEISRLVMNFVVQADNFRQMKDYVALAKKWNATTVFFQRIMHWPDKDVFSPNNPHYNEASRLLEECMAETGVAVQNNI